MQKPPAVRCEHQNGRGCAIYEDRPKGCREWSCLWLLGHFEDSERPDRVGVVMDMVSREHGHRGAIYLAHEAEPGGFDKAMPLLRRLAEKEVVFALRPNGTARAMGAQARIDAAMALFARLGR